MRLLNSLWPFEWNRFRFLIPHCVFVTMCTYNVHSSGGYWPSRTLSFCSSAHSVRLMIHALFSWRHDHRTAFNQILLSDDQFSPNATPITAWSRGDGHLNDFSIRGVSNYSKWNHFFIHAFIMHSGGRWRDSRRRIIRFRSSTCSTMAMAAQHSRPLYVSSLP